MAQGRRAGSAARRYTMPSGAFGAMPPIVSGLQFFGDLSSPSTSIVSGAVATLGDASGNGRNFTQGTGANRPTYNATDANFGGRPSMTFNGTTQFLSNAAIAWPGNTATVFAVFRATSVAGDQRIFSARIGVFANAFRFATNSGNVAMTVANPVGSGETQKLIAASAGVSYRFAATVDLAAAGSSAVPTVYLNGSAGGSYASSAFTAGGPFASVPYAIGATDTGGAAFGGSATDFLVYSGILSASQIAQVDAWLRWRNGL